MQQGLTRLCEARLTMFFPLWVLPVVTQAVLGANCLLSEELVTETLWLTQVNYRQNHRKY